MKFIWIILLILIVILLLIFIYKRKCYFKTDKKIISFSLWGDNECYNYGALENALLAKTIYPGWICRFYIGKNVIKDVINKLEKLDNVEIVKMNKKDQNKHGMFWRFIPAFENNVNIMISRDTDSRLNSREKLAVDEWLNSDKDFHIIRDNESGHKTRILGGMWGCRNNICYKFKSLFYNFYNNIKNKKYGQDQKFLTKLYTYIYDKAYIHDNYNHYKEEKINKIKSTDYNNHIGSVICNDYSLSNELYNMKLKSYERNSHHGMMDDKAL